MKSENKILALCSMAHFLTHFVILIFPALVMPISRSMQLPIGDVVILSFSMYLFYGIFAIPWGYLSDVFNAKVIMAIGIILSGLGFIIASKSSSTLALQIGLSITGIGCSAYHPSGLALISKSCSNRGVALGINGMFGNIGIATAPVAAGILNYFVGWQMTLLLIGSSGIISGLLIMLVSVDTISVVYTHPKTTASKYAMVKLFILFCFAMLASGVLYRGYTIMLPSYFEKELISFITTIKNNFSIYIRKIDSYKDIYTLVATMFVSLVYVIGMVGQLLGGKIADRYDLRWAYALFFLGGLIFLTLTSVSSGSIILLWTGMFILFSLGMQPIENSLVAVVTPEKWRSVSYGIKFTIVFGGGSLAVPIVSAIQKTSSLKQTMTFLLIPMLVVVLLAFAVVFVTKGHSIHQRQGQ